MIQLLALRTFVPKDSGGKEKSFDKKLDIKLEITSLPWLFKNIDKVLEEVWPTDRWNVFYTVARCKDGKREFDESDIIPFDIDGTVEKYRDSYIAAVCSALKIDPLKTGTVSSGNGLHFLVQTKHTVRDPKWFRQNRHHYKAACDKINAALEAAGLPGKADPAVFEARRILRLPGTVNRKPDKPEKMCELVQPDILPQSFDLAELSGIPVVAVTDQVPGSVLKKYPRTDAAAVMAGCQFLAWAKDNPASVSEPEWYAAISVTARLDGEAEQGYPLTHVISSGHPGYSREETEAKIEASLTGSVGPRKCDSLADFGRCSGCPHRGKVSSPIFIRSEDAIPTEDTGFHTLPVDGKSKPRPNYEDLRAYFERQHPYKGMGGAGIVYTWDGQCYRPYESLFIEQFAQTHFNPVANNNMVREFRGLVQRTNVAPVDWWAKTITKKINFQNGYLDMETLEFRPHTPEIGFRYALPYEYDPAATAPVFSKMLASVTGGDEVLQRVIMEFMGYALSNDDCWAQKVLVMVGEGANGKSTLVRVLTDLAGDGNYACSSIDAMGKSEYIRQMLDGKLFNISEETPTKALVDNSLFKSLATGGEVQVRAPYKEPYTLRNRAKLLFTCNALPESPDNSHGFYRRLIIVPFNQTFDRSTPGYDPHIHDKLTTELPGIFNLALAGYQRLAAQGGFTEGEILTQTLETYKVENDSVLFWVKEAMVVHTNGGYEEHWTPIRDLYDAYRSFTEANGSRAVTIQKFGKTLAKLRKEQLGGISYTDRTRWKDVKKDGRAASTRGLQGITYQ